MDIWNDLEKELESYRNISLIIRQYILKYKFRCEALIVEIGGVTYDDSQVKFDELFQIQQRLATVLYKYDFHLDDKIQEFVYHLERDDQYSRLFWYNKFKDGLLWPEE
jgi:hypothetical protein